MNNVLRIKAILFIVIALFISSQSMASDGLGSYAKLLVKSLQDNNAEAYLKTFPEKQDLNKFIYQKLTGDSVNVSEVVNDSTYQQILEKQGDKFTQMINKDNSLGINWEKVALALCFNKF